MNVIKKLLPILLLAASYTSLAQNIIHTVAGSGALTVSGDGGPAILAGLGQAVGVAVDSRGNLYVSDQNGYNVRKITPRGIISTVAGTGFPGYTGDGGPGYLARISTPFSLAVDKFDNLYIADGGNYCVRKVDTFGVITTFAGNNSFGYSGDGGPATNARTGACGLAFDTLGNLYIADCNARVRRVNTAGIISTVAGNGTVGYAGDGGPATAATLDGPIDVAVDKRGFFYIADRNNDCIRRVNMNTGNIITYAGTTITGFLGDGGAATSARFNGPNGLAIDDSGHLFIADQNNHRIRRINYLTGIINTIAGTGTNGYSGDGGVPTSARLSSPAEVCFNARGNMFIADRGSTLITSVLGHRVREVLKRDTLHISVSPSDTLCGATPVTFTARPRSAPYWSDYRWRVNGVLVGTDSSSYTSSTLSNGDFITCTIIDTAQGGIIISYSDTVTMVVRSVVVPSVSIITTGDTVCNGAGVFFTAAGINGGSAPVYTWKRFGTTIGTGPTLSYVPAAGDIITVFFTSNALCATPTTVSASRTMFIIPSFRPAMDIHAYPNDTIAHWGQIISLFSDITYGGSAPVYEWYSNGDLIPGATTSTYSKEVYANDTLYCVMHSNAFCAVPATDTSNKVIISTGRLSVDGNPDYDRNIRIVPNPNQGSFTISNFYAVLDGMSYSVLDMFGKVVHSGDMNFMTPGEHKVTLPPYLPNGLYFVVLDNELERKVTKFVLMR